MLNKTQRTQAIERLEKDLGGASGLYLTDINKIDTGKMSRLRVDFRKKGIKYLVVKNTLARIALERCGRKELSPFFKGPVGVAISMVDSTAPAKVIRDFQKEFADLLPLKVAYVDGALFNAADAKKLADLPSREVLLSQLLSVLKAPMTNFAGSLSGIMTKFVGTLESVKAQKEANS